MSCTQNTNLPAAILSFKCKKSMEPNPLSQSMDSNYRVRKVYPILGIFSIIAFLYLNLGDHFTFPILWQPKMEFIKVNSTRFTTINGGDRIESTVYVNGWNSYWLMEESVWVDSRIKVSEVLRRGGEMGMTVCRTWAFSDGNDTNYLHVEPNVFNERVFQGLDYVIVEARKNGIRLILSLVNNLDAFGGKAQYVKWAQEAGFNVSSSPDSFFSHPVIKDFYKDYIKAIVTRKNSLSRVEYFEEPAIFAWELINEPRCASSSSASVLEQWITEMAAYIKSLDKNHLVTVGLEGFYGLETSEKSETNPGKWAASLGSDFLQNSLTQNIDFASVHAYPDSWIPDAELEAKVKYLSQWVDSHISDGDHILKKPVLFTEIGSSLHKQKQDLYGRDILLKTVYDRMYESAKKRQSGAGALIWQLLVEGLEEKHGDKFSFVAWDHPSTYKLIVDQSKRLKNLFE